MVSRFVANGPVKQEGICIMPQPPQHFRMLQPQRTDGYHVAAQAYVQQQPPNQGNNQIPPLRGMPPTGPPNQASTPPNADLKLQMAQQQQPSMNVVPAFLSQIPVRGPAQNLFATRAPQPPTQTPRMANHRQGQQHMFQAQPQYVPILQQSVPYINTPGSYYNGGPGPRPQPGFVAAPFQMISGPAYTTYPTAQSQPATYDASYYFPSDCVLYGSQPMLQRPPFQSVATVQQNPTQPTAAQLPLPPPPQQWPSKKRLHAIPIIDPTTGKGIEINEQDDSHPPSGESSARQTPQPPIPNSKEVQAAFARQVTEAIKDEEIPIEEFDSGSVIEPMNSHMFSVPPQAVSHQKYDSIIQSSKLQVATKEFIPAGLHTAKETTPVVSAITDAVEVTIPNKPKDRESPSKVRKPREQTNIIVKESINVQEKDDEEINEKLTMVIVEENKPIDSIATNAEPSMECAVTNLDTQIPQQEELSSIPVPTMSTEVVEETKLEENIPETVALSNLDVMVSNAKNKQTITTTKRKELPKQAQQVQQTTQSHSQPQPHITTPPAPVIQKVIQQPPVPLSQPTKPNNKSNKMRDINIKGAKKEGTDMDAFNDNSIEQNNITNITQTELYSDYVNNDNSTVLNNNEDANKNNDITTINQSIKPIIEPKTKGKFDVTDIVKDTPKPIKSILAPPPVEPSDEVDHAVLANEKLVQAKNEVNAKVNAIIIDTNLQDIKLNLQYGEDQWSPINQQGQKVYGAELLLALRDHPKSKLKPENMNIPPDLMAGDKGRNDMNRYPGGGRQADFAPNFGNISIGGKSSSRGGLVKRKSQQGPTSGSINKAGNRTSVIRVSISVKEDVKLKEVENAWRPARFVTGENMTEDDKKTEILYKKVRGVLNKLTPQKFTQLLDQIKNFQIDTTERLQGVIDLVFEKAVDEPNFSVAYASLCKELSLFSVKTGHIGDTKGVEKETTDSVNFRKLLVTRCQLEFEKNSADETERNAKLKEIELCADDEKKKEMGIDLEEHDRRLRMKSVGNIRFIGELFKQNMLTVAIMVRCLNHLVQAKDEESLECLCKLTSTVGLELESRKVDLNGIFSIMKEIVEGKHKKISSRVRFMIQDVIDLRQSQWVPRRQDFNPKTMDQIQKDAENEQLNIQAMNSGPTPRKDERVTSASVMHSNDRKTRRTVGSDEWQTSQTRNRGSSQITVNSDKLKIQTPLTDEPFGSRQMFADWSGGSKAKSSITNNNMYYALNDNASDIDRKTTLNMRSHTKDNYNSKGPSLEGNFRSYEDGRGSRSGSQHRSRDNSASHRNAQLNSLPPTSMPTTTYVPPRVPTVPAPRDQPPTVSAVAEMTPDEFEIQLKKILEDYLTDSDINLCDKDIRRLFPLSELPKIVTEGYNSVLEKSKSARWGAGQLFANLIKIGTLSVENYCIGLTNVLSVANDLIIDIPKLWDYLGELIAPLICEQSITLRDLQRCSEDLISTKYASKLLVSLFNLIIQEKGPVFLNGIWRLSGVTLDNFIPESEIDGFIKHNNFECLLNADSTTSRSNSVLSQQEIYDKLVMFIRGNTSFDDIVNWVTANVGEEGVQQPAFVRSLATACFGECIVHDKFKADIFKSKLNLMQRYINSQSLLELQCLFAIQTLSCKLEYPSGLLLAIFDKIYEETLISLESFLAWEQSTDPAEQEGKGVALKQLTSFFIQLKEGEYEDDDDSCGSAEETGGG